MLSLSQLVAATGGQFLGVTEIEFTGVSTDSRTINSGELFIAVRGERHDGRDFAQAAIDRGAAAVLVDSPIPALPCIVVDDTVDAYGRIAAAHLEQLRRDGLIVVGITGSSGKTTTKDLLASVLGERMAVVASEASLNNDIGLPATVLRANSGTQVLILEMGMRGLGHIRRLCDIAAPDISVVLNVGHAHIGELGSQDAIAQAKCEIVEWARQPSTAVLNGDDHRVRAMADKAHGRVLLFGEHGEFDVRATHLVVRADGTAAFNLHVAETDVVPVELAVIGQHQVSNACAVATVAHALGMTSADIAGGLSRARIASRWRMELHRTTKGVTIVNDAYNANPDSTAAALRALAQMPCTGRRVAVLGEMLELGAVSRSAHVRIGELSRALGIDLVVAVGAVADWIAEGRADAETVGVADSDSATSQLTSVLQSGDLVLIKASRSVGLERVGIALAEQFGTVSA